MNRDSSLGIATLRNEQTNQISTFDRNVRKKVPVRRGETITLGDVSGCGYIAQLWLTFPGWFWRNWEPEAPISTTILKTLILRIYWDNSDKPAVEAPLGDFFGVGFCEVANFTSRYIGMSSGGFYTRFPMPFRKRFRIEIENRDAEIDTQVYANVLYQLTEHLPDHIAYFHSHFATGENTGSQPLGVANVSGRGHYAGCTLSIQAQDYNYLGFLEAPEYVFIDEDWEHARIVGTGLEDYFMGGWYFREGLFSGDLHGLPVKDALNSMTAMYRIHDADAIHFQHRFRIEFTNPFVEEARQFRHSSAAFLYLDSPEGQPPPLPSTNQLLCWYRMRNRDHQSIP